MECPLTGIIIGSSRPNSCPTANLSKAALRFCEFLLRHKSISGAGVNLLHRGRDRRGAATFWLPSMHPHAKTGGGCAHRVTDTLGEEVRCSRAGATPPPLQASGILGRGNKAGRSARALTSAAPASSTPPMAPCIGTGRSTRACQRPRSRVWAAPAYDIRDRRPSDRRRDPGRGHCRPAGPRKATRACRACPARERRAVSSHDGSLARDDMDGRTERGTRLPQRHLRGVLGAADGEVARQRLVGSCPSGRPGPRSWHLRLGVRGAPAMEPRVPAAQS